MTRPTYSIVFITQGCRSEYLGSISIPSTRLYRSELRLCRFLYRSRRARNILMYYTSGRRRYTRENVLIHHPLFSTPLTFHVDTHDRRLCNMLYARILFLTGRY